VISFCTCIHAFFDDVKVGALLKRVIVLPTYVHTFFVANTFQIQPFHKRLVMQVDAAFCFKPGE
jgi:hypothetical protein